MSLVKDSNSFAGKYTNNQSSDRNLIKLLGIDEALNNPEAIGCDANALRVMEETLIKEFLFSSIFMFLFKYF